MCEHRTERDSGNMIEMVLWEHLTEEQQSTLLLRFLDHKIRKKTMRISMMRDRIMLMEEKLDIMRAMRDMLKGSG